MKRLAGIEATSLIAGILLLVVVAYGLTMVILSSEQPTDEPEKADGGLCFDDDPLPSLTIQEYDYANHVSALFGFLDGLLQTYPALTESLLCKHGLTYNDGADRAWGFNKNQ